MKMLTEYNETKLAQFHGLTLNVDTAAKWLAADSDGRVYGYVHEPSMADGLWYPTKGPSCLAVEVDLEGMDWRETLIELD
jgi:hypothetical protein